MADCEAPSFSLGLDLDHLVDDESPSRSPLSPPATSVPLEDDEGIRSQVVEESDHDVEPDPPTRILKRLRRGPGNEKQQSCLDGEDDIEEFSSQEDLLQVDAHPSKRNQPLCSSSKVSLNTSTFITSHSSSNWKERKTKHTSDIPVSGRLEMGQSGLMFPKLTTSPLRRFQLLDSDSDDNVSEDVSGAHKVDPCSKEPTFKPSEPVTFEKNRNTSFKMHENHDLWKDFSSKKSYSIPTPALNEVCDEYFRSTKDKEIDASVSVSHNESLFGATSSCQIDEQILDSAYPLPPAHRYFFHEDPRIRKLVQRRLCHYSPLGVDRVNQQPDASHIDYMDQFNGEASKKKGVQTGNLEKNSASGRNKSKKLTVEEPFHSTAGWVDPKNNSSFSNGESSRGKATKKNNTKNTVRKRKRKSNIPNSSDNLNASASWVEPKGCANVPKDAGKRRVQASGNSAGHWFTGSDGRKVYVTKGGQELTGQMAYRHYRKESGSGFKKSKKKTSAKKKRS